MQRLLLVFACVLAVACSKNDEPPPPSSGSPNAQRESGPRHRPATGGATAGGGAEQARQMFATVCATCHGADGRGDGPAAAGLGSAKPRDYTDAAWQSSVTDDEIRKAILGGGVAVGKSPMMPGNPQLKDKPEVVDALVQIVRGFGKK